jgi:(S)-ureidoglycine aminohydrolase
MNGSTRGRVTSQYALLTPDTFVYSRLPGWSGTEIAIHIAPALGAGFTQYSALMQPSGNASPASDGIERFIFVESGEALLELAGKKHNLTAGSFAFAPADIPHSLSARQATRLDVFEKPYVPLDGVGMPEPIVGNEQSVADSPFMGDERARLKLLLPDTAEYDLAINIFAYEPGAHLPQVEIHVMEHGLKMLSGAGVYRLADDWHPVQSGDVIWMAPFCPQWFVAMGKHPARYLYYKDVNRTP